MKETNNVFILGDSYSAFEGYIPAECVSWYSNEQKEVNDVRHVEQMWWYDLFKIAGNRLAMNCSYSGTTVCHTGYDGENCSYKSFVARFQRLVEENYFQENRIDTFIIFGGTNDCWANSPIGEVKYSDFNNQDLFSFLPACCYLLNTIKKVQPKVKILVVMNTELKEEMYQGVRLACTKYGVDLLELKNIDKQFGHPSIAGMKQIKEQVVKALYDRN